MGKVEFKYFSSPAHGSYLVRRPLYLVCTILNSISACPMQAIGVASSDAFPDNRFTASSTSSGNEAFKGRLNGGGAWLPSDNNNPNDYLQIDLVYEFVVCAVATQGNPTSNDWTTKYKLQMALIDFANNWRTYQENSVDKVCIIIKENNITV